MGVCRFIVARVIGRRPAGTEPMRPPGRARRKGREMLGQLYDRALDGERCWIRHQDGELRSLPAHRWLGALSPDGSSGDASDEVFDEGVAQMCSGPTIELGCGPGRLVARLIRRGIPALGIDRSATAIRLAGRGGAPALLGDVFEPSPQAGGAPSRGRASGIRSCWSTATSASAGTRAGSWAAPSNCRPAAGVASPSSTPRPSASGSDGCVWSRAATSGPGSGGHRWA